LQETEVSGNMAEDFEEHVLREKRKIQTRLVRGQPYYLLSLPKPWVEVHGLQGEMVYVSYNGDGDLKVSKIEKH